MAVLTGEKTGRQYEAAKDGDSATRVFLVTATAKTEDADDIFLVAGMPVRGDIHPKNPTIIVDSVSAAQDDSTWWKWVVTVTYSKPEDEEDEDPLDREPKTSYVTESITVAAAAEVDENTGNPTKAIANTAGDAFDPPPEMEIDILIISIKRNETAEPFSIATFYDYTNSLNSDSFQFGDVTFGPGKVKLRIAIGEKQIYVDNENNEIPYREVNYTLAANPLGWDLNILDIGPQYIGDGSTTIDGEVAEDGVKTPFNSKGEPYAGLLNGVDGKASGGVANFLVKKIKKRRPFAALQLPPGP